MQSALVLTLSMMLAVSAGCGSNSSDDGDDADASVAADAQDDGCGEAPGPEETPGQCEAWDCTATAPPACWDCAMVAAHEGDPCSEDGGVVCAGGECVDLQDPGTPGALDATSADHEVEIGDDTLSVTVYLPDGAGPYPVVVFSDGFMLDPSLYASYGQHLASWGYVVVMPDLPGSILDSYTHVELADLLIGLLDWIDDNAAVAAGPLGGVADAERLALAGHSMGGKISLLVATQDDRPLAVFGVDPVDAAGPSGTSADYPSVAPELMDQIDVPLVLLGETTNATGGIGQPCAPAADNFHQYYLAATSPAVEIEVVGAFHMSFLDNPACGLTCSACPSGTDDTATTRLLTRRYLTSFLNLHLRDQTLYRDFLAGTAMAADVEGGLVLTANKNGF